MAGVGTSARTAAPAAIHVVLLVRKAEPNETSGTCGGNTGANSVATVTPSTNAFVADLVKSRSLGAAMGVFGTIWDSGEAMGPIIAGALLGVTTYSLSFILIALVMLAAMLVFQIGVRDPVTDQDGLGAAT